MDELSQLLEQPRSLPFELQQVEPESTPLAELPRLRSGAVQGVARAPEPLIDSPFDTAPQAAPSHTGNQFTMTGGSSATSAGAKRPLGVTDGRWSVDRGRASG